MPPSAGMLGFATDPSEPDGKAPAGDGKPPQALKPGGGAARRCEAGAAGNERPPTVQCLRCPESRRPPSRLRTEARPLQRRRPRRRCAGDKAVAEAPRSAATERCGEGAAGLGPAGGEAASGPPLERPDGRGSGDRTTPGRSKLASSSHCAITIALQKPPHEGAPIQQALTGQLQQPRVVLRRQLDQPGALQLRGGGRGAHRLRIHQRPLAAPLLPRFVVELQESLEHRVRRKLLSEISLEVRELSVQLVQTFQVQALVERMLQQPHCVGPVVQQLLEQVPPSQEERVPSSSRQAPRFDKIHSSEALCAIPRVEESCGNPVSRRDGIPTKALDVSTENDRGIQPNAAVARQQRQAHAIRGQLGLPKLGEAIRQLGLGEVLAHRRGVQDSHLPTGAMAPPRLDAELEQLGHIGKALGPIAPQRPLRDLPGHAPAR
mmetsp:Transcript_165879/g.532573  ORF Transcript_165879/g.532573 Transcript_165879/m.532573 type:complete len:434 (-) Transcript_165879:486-1787(-)